MTDLLSWLESYSAPVVIIMALGATFLYLAKTVVEKGVGEALATHAEELRLRLGRRSAFEEKVLTDRYMAFQDLFSRIQRVTTIANRMHGGEPPPHGFLAGSEGLEIVAVTEIFEDIATKEPILGPRLHNALYWAAEAATDFVNRAEAMTRWGDAQEELMEAAEQEFGLSRIRWEA